MTSVLLNAFYDTVNQSVGPTLAWVFVLLMFIELVYVMAKYLGAPKDKK
jgi:amino acid permease